MEIATVFWARYRGSAKSYSPCRDRSWVSQSGHVAIACWRSQGFILIGRFFFVSSRGSSKVGQLRARGAARIVESAWSPLPPSRRSGVHLASKSSGLNSFVFSEGYL